MRVIFFRRHAWTILLALCIFVGGNIVLFYKFMVRKELEHKRAQKLAIEYFQHMNLKPSSRLADLANYIRKNRIDSSLDDMNGSKTNEAESFKEKEEKIKDFNNNKVTIETGTEKGVGLNKLKLETIKDIEIKTERSDSAQQGDQTLDKSAQRQLSTETKVTSSSKNYKFAVLVIACNRPTVKRCLDQLIKYRPSPEKYPIVVSQDCGDSKTASVIRSYGDQVTHVQQPDLGNVNGVPNNMLHFMGYYKISRHYRWALGQMFDVMKYNTVIIVEDDLDIAPDFFEYFTATRPLLDEDQSLWCVSAWNDNGKEGMVKGHDLLYRTDFFSGLGWMLTKNVWEELRPKWPLGFWDDWMRDPAQHKNRACIRPEICRTRTFGKIGVSKGQFFDQHLKFIKLNDKKFPFTETDVSYLLKEKYDPQFQQKLNSIPIVTVHKLTTLNSNFPEVKIEYLSNADFEHIARSLTIMSDFKAGIARVSYKGVVIFMYHGTRVFLAPKQQI